MQKDVANIRLATSARPPRTLPTIAGAGTGEGAVDDDGGGMLVAVADVTRVLPLVAVGTLLKVLLLDAATAADDVVVKRTSRQWLAGVAAQRRRKTLNAELL